MRIILFEIFGIQIKSYGLMIAIGIIVAAALFINKGKKKGFDEDSLLNLIIFAGTPATKCGKSNRQDGRNPG